MMIYRLVFLITVMIFWGCNRSPRAASDSSSTPSATLAMPVKTRADSTTAKQEQAREFDRLLDRKFGSDKAQKDEIRDVKNLLDAEGDALEKVAAENHQNLVEKASPDFRPEPFDRKIKLRIILEKSRISPGENLRYRLEMQNVGRKTLHYSELSPSIFKFNGIGYSPTISFFFRGPGGEKGELHAAMANLAKAPDRKNVAFLPEKLSEDQKKDWYLRTQADSAAVQHFKVSLEPGETLRTLSDSTPAAAGFRTLWCEEGFTKPGKYSIKISLDDRPTKPDEEVIAILLKAGDSRASIARHYDDDLRKAIGPVSSEPVVFEVVR